VRQDQLFGQQVQQADGEGEHGGDVDDGVPPAAGVGPRPDQRGFEIDQANRRGGQRRLFPPGAAQGLLGSGRTIVASEGTDSGSGASSWPSPALAATSATSSGLSGPSSSVW